MSRRNLSPPWRLPGSSGTALSFHMINLNSSFRQSGPTNSDVVKVTSEESIHNNYLLRFHGYVCVSLYSFNCYPVTQDGVANNDVSMVTPERTPNNY
jgi:hypothetical protein